MCSLQLFSGIVSPHNFQIDGPQAELTENFFKLTEKSIPTTVFYIDFQEDVILFPTGLVTT